MRLLPALNASEIGRSRPLSARGTHFHRGIDFAVAISIQFAVLADSHTIHLRFPGTPHREYTFVLDDCKRSTLIEDEMKTGFLIDMDGVLYRGNQLIPGADEFIKTLKERNTPFLFLTNNSQRTRRDVAMKLQRMEIEVDETHVFTCILWFHAGLELVCDRYVELIQHLKAQSACLFAP